MATENTAIQTLWAKQEKRICESLVGISSGVGAPNAFGRTCSVFPADGLALAAGLAAGGQRVSVLLSHHTGHCSDWNALRQASRNHLPLIVAFRTDDFSDVFRAAAQGGAVLLRANSDAEWLDFSLIAHYIAEAALLPVVVVAPVLSIAEEDAVVRDDEFVRAFLGDTADAVKCATPAQEMVFGHMRRRVPRWFNTDTAILANAQLTLSQHHYAAQARHNFFLHHADDIIRSGFDAFSKLAGKPHLPFQIPTGKEETLCLTCDTEFAALLQTLRPKGGLSVATLKQCWPLPAALRQIKAKRIGVFAPSAETASPLFEQVSVNMAHTGIPLVSAQYVHMPSHATVSAFVDAWLQGTLLPGQHSLEVQKATTESAFPKHEVHLQNIKREYPNLANAFFGKASAAPRKMPHQVPMSVRRYADKGPIYARVSDFFDRDAFFTDTESSEWVLHPTHAMSAMPPATADFGISTAERKTLPVFDAGTCTACGDCAVYCPYGAIPPVALTLFELIKSGIERAKKSGATIGQIMPLQKTWAAAAARLAAKWYRDNEKNNKITALKVGVVLAPAFEEALMGSRVNEEKAEALRTESSEVLQAIGGVSVAVSEKVFLRPHETEAGTGTLFTLAIDTNACTGCGICAEVCPTEALQMQLETPGIKQQTDTVFAQWESLADTSSDTIERLLSVQDYSPFSALMLSRNYYRAMSGSGSGILLGHRAALHAALTVAEAVLQPGTQKAIALLDRHIEALSANIKSALTGALPVGHLEDIGKVVGNMQSGKVSVDELLQHPALQHGRKLLDRDTLHRKSNLLGELNLYRDLLTSGPTGVGRARMGIVLDSSLAHLTYYPENPFNAPVIMWDTRAPEVARGLLESHLRHAVDEVKLLRRAALEAEGGFNPLIQGREIDALQWEGLTEEEKLIVPPLLFVANREVMHRDGLSVIASLCTQQLPIKVLLFDDGAHRPEAGTEWAVLQSAVLAMMAAGEVHILRSSMAEPRHLFNGLVQGFSKTSSSFIWVLAPAVGGGFVGKRQHELALHTRAFTHFDYVPGRPGKLFSSRLHIDGNPDVGALWSTVVLKYSVNNEEMTMDYAITPADWYYHFRENASHFTPADTSDANNVSVAEYLKLNTAEQRQKQPVIFRVQPDGVLKAYTVSAEVFQRVHVQAQAWQLLRELAGEITEFPEKLEVRAHKEAAVTYQKEKEQIISDHATRIAELEADYLERIRMQIRDKLVELSLSSLQNE